MIPLSLVLPAGSIHLCNLARRADGMRARCLRVIDARPALELIEIFSEIEFSRDGTDNDVIGRRRHAPVRVLGRPSHGA
jgi:hypothetical protein